MKINLFFFSVLLCAAVVIASGRATGDLLVSMITSIHIILFNTGPERSQK